MSRFLLIEQVAADHGASVRTVHAWAAKGLIPNLRLPGVRRILFDPAHLAAWQKGAELETIETPGGGRVCRPRGAEAS